MTATDTLPLLDAALRGALLALLLLLAAAVSRLRAAHTAVRVAPVFLCALAVQVVSSAPAFESRAPWLLQTPLIGISVGNSVLFWLFAKALFDDDFVLRHRHVAVWFAVVVMGILFCLTAVPPRPSVPWAVALRLAMRWTPICFAALAIAAAAAQWRADLVEQRRHLRWFIVAAGTAYTVAMAAARLAAPHGQLSSGAASLDVAGLLLILAVVAVRVLTLSAAELLPAAASGSVVLPAQVPPMVREPQASPAPDPAEDRLARELSRLMTQEHAYRTEDLTVASLAARLGAPEYRLRRVINRRLGHRNFNAYVNGFRLAQAQAALADPAQQHLSVLSVALEAGFQSIGPFNRAFKTQTGLTPTEYRRQKLGDC